MTKTDVCDVYFLPFFASSTGIPVRLQGSSSSNGTGRVEVYHEGEWGTICDDNWSIKNAHVVCRQLGYLYAVRVLPISQVPDGSGRIWMDEVRCTGSEENLLLCHHIGFGRHDCGHVEDVGVECTSVGNKHLQAPFRPYLQNRKEPVCLGFVGSVRAKPYS